MCYFLSMLSFSDVAMSMATLPTVLRTFCLNARTIDFDACLIQMFLIHSFSMMESGILLAMSFDRYVAICDPLRYATVLTNEVIAGMGLAVASRSFNTLFPLPLPHPEAAYLQIQCPFPLLLPSPRHDEAGLC